MPGYVKVWGPTVDVWLVLAGGRTVGEIERSGRYYYLSMADGFQGRYAMLYLAKRAADWRLGWRGYRVRYKRLR